MARSEEEIQVLNTTLILAYLSCVPIPDEKIGSFLDAEHNVDAQLLAERFGSCGISFVFKK